MPSTERQGSMREETDGERERGAQRVTLEPEGSKSVVAECGK